MNYRHAYHAGNHTEVFKHAVLVRLIAALQAKEKPLFVLDTHAGAGLYDLEATEARKTNEADAGIRAVEGDASETLKPYLDLVRGFGGKYPGSPSLIAKLLRSQDRAALCELHEEDFGRLRRLFLNNAQVALHRRDGYEAMMAFVPPLERRGLIFTDPPYEATDEMQTLATSLIAAHAKWPTGVYAAWYPIKDRRQARALKDALRERFIPDVLAVEFLRYPIDGERLAGSGMVVINPPWNLDDWLNTLCADLANAFGAGEGAVEWVTQPT
ncbi:MAG TPA: 23S rRNA (adenine(2030)-N(6))-methyltransferase RlmJ [Rhizomicrobium sp.]|jgi:23S rRNA (adenine2030-N6)-methyltransferase